MPVITVDDILTKSWLCNCTCHYFYIGFSEEQNAVTAANAEARLTGARQATKAAPGCQKESVPEQTPFTGEGAKRRPKAL